MRHQDLKKGQIYTNVLDVAIPLQFTGRKETKNNMGDFSTIAYFKPVKTDSNKNWYNDIKIYTKNFDNVNGNSYIK